MAPQVKPWLRLEGAATYLRSDPRSEFVAFTEPDGTGLKVLNLENRKIYLVTSGKVAGSFFWSPAGFRLFYRELILNKDHTLASQLYAYDTKLRKSVALQEIPSSSGFLTFDPRDLRFQIMHAKGVLSRRIFFPDERLARWQVAQRTENGKWLATQKGILWLTQQGFTMRRLKDDHSDVESFSISPDGQAIAWATKGGSIYYSRDGSAPRKLDDGRDPTWHPKSALLLYAAARKVGDQVVDYDLRIVDVHGNGRYLTKTQMSPERWPQWLNNGQRIIYTLDQTTDLLQMDFK